MREGAIFCPWQFLSNYSPPMYTTSFILKLSTGPTFLLKIPHFHGFFVPLSSFDRLTPMCFVNTTFTLELLFCAGSSQHVTLGTSEGASSCVTHNIIGSQQKKLGSPPVQLWSGGVWLFQGGNRGPSIVA